jgi:hypothetical protein
MDADNRGPLIQSRQDGIQQGITKIDAVGMRQPPASVRVAFIKGVGDSCHV